MLALMRLFGLAHLMICMGLAPKFVCPATKMPSGDFGPNSLQESWGVD
jgi:hypothetical protein